MAPQAPVPTNPVLQENWNPKSSNFFQHSLFNYALKTMLRPSFPLKENFPCKKRKFFVIFGSMCCRGTATQNTHVSGSSQSWWRKLWGRQWTKRKHGRRGDVALWAGFETTMKEIDRSASAIQNLVIKAFEDCVSAISHRWRNSIMSLKRNETIECATSFVM